MQQAGENQDILKEIKEITGTFTARCGAMQSSSGKVVLEDKHIKSRLAAVHGRVVQTGSECKQHIHLPSVAAGSPIVRHPQTSEYMDCAAILRDAMSHDYNNHEISQCNQ